MPIKHSSIFANKSVFGGVTAKELEYYKQTKKGCRKKRNTKKRNTKKRLIKK